MPDPIVMNPAEKAAEVAFASLYSCIDQYKSFLFEAGAGAGKTYSLVEALKYLVNKQGASLLRQNQKVACITYTNVASDEIKSRTKGHPAVLSSTIHAFCWSMIKDFQPYLREKLLELTGWPERLAEAEVDGVGTRKIDYDLGYRKIGTEHVYLSHDDILAMMVKLMEQAKFRNLFVARYPILFIDEYQDTDKAFAEALKTHFLGTQNSPLIGFFGDHWQKIYGDGCGKIEHESLEIIGKESNFRSAPRIVECLNRMRPELPQFEADSSAEGFVDIYHTNSWFGERRTGSHWAGDLPAEIAYAYLEALKDKLEIASWDFSPDKTKILMLTHKVLAAKQGYSTIADIFPYNEMYIKKEDPYIAFFVDTLEPVCMAYENKQFGKMFEALDGRTPNIRSHADKVTWAEAMNKLLDLRSKGTIGEVLEHIRTTRIPRLPDAVDHREQELKLWLENPGDEEPSSINRLRRLKNVAYQEVITLAQFIEGHTPFATKHGVKGAEFENVLVVFGRGWNHYNFNNFLEWAENPESVPLNKRDTYERNRNLFYVVCSRPKKRLAVLFTQELSGKAIATLTDWFGDKAVHSIYIGNK